MKQVPGAPPPLTWLQDRLTEASATALADELIARIDFLQHERHKRLVPLLRRFCRGPLPWTATDVVDHIRLVDARRQQPAFTADRIRTRPAAVLAGYLRGVDVQDDHPRTWVLAEMDRHDHGVHPNRREDWCGECEVRTRHVELDDGRMARCPSCHPLR